MAKKKESTGGDRHKPSRMVRVREILAQQLDKVAESRVNSSAEAALLIASIRLRTKSSACALASMSSEAS
jgi:hypothetical protein